VKKIALREEGNVYALPSAECKLSLDHEKHISLLRRPVALARRTIHMFLLRRIGDAVSHPAQSVNESGDLLILRCPGPAAGNGIYSGSCLQRSPKLKAMIAQLSIHFL